MDTTIFCLNADSTTSVEPNLTTLAETTTQNGYTTVHPFTSAPSTAMEQTSTRIVERTTTTYAENMITSLGKTTLRTSIITATSPSIQNRTTSPNGQPTNTFTVRQTQSTLITNNATATSTLPLALLHCSVPVITLIPSTSSMSSPLISRRSEDFYIGSYLQLQCNASLSTMVQWTIHPCTSVCSPVSQLISQSVVTATTELYVPAQSFDLGTYMLRLQVSMLAVPQLIATASAYVTVTPSGITANLMRFGTSMITLGRGKDLLLDPGTYSDDPDVLAFNASVGFDPLREKAC